MRILVSGANGFIGRHLVPVLKRNGHDVFAPTRGADGSPFDLGTVAEWTGWPKDLDAVIHLAALNPSRTDPRSKDVAALHRVNVEGTRLLAGRAAAEGVGRFLFLSTANVHRPKGTVCVTEADAPLPQSAYAASKLAAEGVLREIGDVWPMAVCVLRPAPVHGIGGRGAMGVLTRLARLPFPVPGGSLQRRSVLGIDNCVDAIAAALVHPAAAGETFLLTDPEPLAVGEMIAAMRSGIGRRTWRVPAVPLPERLMAGAGNRSGLIHQIFGSFVIDASRIERRLGWRPPLSTAEGLAKAMRP
ncbi:MAG: NAD-dependent epimerase/dehydratase family protein [Rhizobiaceae bacterium]|nr:NAD-dependent epimerase/dehydratase family protein [Rhizobiaceae bacterium]